MNLITFQIILFLSQNLILILCDTSKISFICNVFDFIILFEYQFITVKKG